MKRVLVVDDDPRNCDLIRVRLEEAGFGVMVAFDGEAGLARVRGEPRPDAVLADVLLPVRDGYELCAEIKRDPELLGIPVVLMSAIYLSASERERGLRIGAGDDVVQADLVVDKPLRFESVIEDLGWLLDAGDEAPSPRRRCSILVVDDDPSNRRLIGLALRHQPDLEILEAPDAMSAFEVLENRPIDLVLSDIQMPGVSGLEVLYECRKRWPETTIVMMTAHGSEEVAIEAMKLGAHDYLVKPLDVGRLGVTLAENLAQHQIRIERDRYVSQLKETSRDLISRIEELDRRNAELAALNARMEQILEARSRLLESFTHDFRTPLTVMRGALGILAEKEDLPDETRKDLVGRALGNVRRLAARVDSLLDAERADSGVAEEPCEPINLVTAVRSASQDLQTYASEREMTIRVSATVSEVLVLAEPDAVHRIVSNLISNAIKYGDPGTPIVVTVDRMRGCGRVDVADRGPGIPDDLKERLFERYVRRPHAGQPSTGLGLSIVRMLVERFGGRCDVRDRPGGGALFWFELPEVVPDEGEAPAADEELVATIGLADDRRAALAPDATGLCHHDGPESVRDDIREGRFSGLVIDLTTPVGRGGLLEIIHQLRAAGRDVSVGLIATESASDRELLREAKILLPVCRRLDPAEAVAHLQGQRRGETSAGAPSS